MARQIGRMRDPLRLMEPEPARTAAGEQTLGAGIPHPMYCEDITNRPGTEQRTAVGIEGRTTALVRIRWRAGVTPLWWVEGFRGAVWDIHSAQGDSGNRYIELVLVSREVRT